MTGSRESVDILEALAGLRRDVETTLIICCVTGCTVAIAIPICTLKMGTALLVCAGILCVELHSFCTAVVFVGAKLPQASAGTKLAVAIVAPVTYGCLETRRRDPFFLFFIVRILSAVPCTAAHPVCTVLMWH